MSDGRAVTSPTLALVGVTAIWGSTFVVVKDAVEKMPVTDFLTWRFGLAALVMLLLRPRSVAALGPSGRRAGVLVGLALGAGYLLQTLGLQHTSAAVSGFITGMFVVLTPLGSALLLRSR
ncbi:MAG TPA: DMT family transporter, partial [Mycobacteriales bacterium]|nr:DMT family transporter [Mycobacteriales bacterium]